jgi:geranylgeranyl pyrophosphate synthase
VIQDRLNQCKARVEACLQAQLKTLSGSQSQLHDAMGYALSVGGKRLRPALVYTAAMSLRETLDINPPQLTPLDLAAAAVEAMHTYSLVHDDLPAMDNDDLRRGKPTVHVAYDEAMAILAGDALQTWAFELLTKIENLPADTVLAMIKELAQASGASGMVEGQALDIEATGGEQTLDYLKQLHQLKTGALIRAALRLGALAMNAGLKERRLLSHYGEAVGLCFQVVDDILDVTTDTATLGKTAGKDTNANKLTYVKLLGLEGAKAEAQRLCDEAKSIAAQLPNPKPLIELADYFVQRAY